MVYALEQWKISIMRTRNLLITIKEENHGTF